MQQLAQTEKTINKLCKEGALASHAVIVGYGGREWKLYSDDVNDETYFDMASVCKVFPTSTLILQAVNQGLISLEDTLAKFFPEDKKDFT